jgi:putative intracellular protease/amidase
MVRKLLNMEKKILFVVTSHDKKGNTGEKTGYYLGEVSHPWEVLHKAGYRNFGELGVDSP